MLLVTFKKNNNNSNKVNAFFCFPVATSGTAKISTPLLEYLKMKKSSRGRPASSVSSDGGNTTVLTQY